MASLKNKVQKVEEEVDKETVATGNDTSKAPEITYIRKVNFDKRPTLKAFLSVKACGTFTKATFTEKENGDESQYGVLFQSRKYEDKNGKPQRRDFIHPIDKDTRQAIVDGLLQTFTQLFENKFDADKDTYEGDGVVVRYPKEKNNFEGQIGEASITISKPMVLNNVELHEKDGKFFVVYPSRNYTDANGEWQSTPICGPSDKESNASITEAAVKAYQELK